ncbi:hypothetical protein L218DRAFT_142546 [Marasmius fiardii PR-910]|nr:hypothetical protein L218DRAFT_142546 [Marasmius fiardii PR-910]
MRTLGLSAALLVAIVSPSGRAQEFPPAKCDPATGFDWAFNSKNQSPCDVASYLGGACNNGEFSIPALNASQSYLGPTLLTANPCRCNTVFYSLLSACAACQGRIYQRWSLYDGNCSTVYTNFPGDIPSGTAVPSWAYLDISSSDTFEPDRAKALANGPESTGTPKPTGSNTPPPLVSPTAASSDSGGSNNSSNAGAIAGGVVGGVAGVAIIAVFAFWFLRRRRGRSRVDPSFDINTGYLPEPYTSATSPEPSTRIASPYSTVSGSQKLYDPSDPSTFPNAVGMQTHPQPFTSWQSQAQPSIYQHHRSQSAESSSIQPGNASIYSTPSGHNRNYSGTAEI